MTLVTIMTSKKAQVHGGPQVPPTLTESGVILLSKSDG